jgi:hypothetical protein
VKTPWRKLLFGLLVAVQPCHVTAGEFTLADVTGVAQPYQIGGWTNAAYYTDNIPLSFTDDDMGSFDDLPHRLNLAQQWLYFGKSVDGSKGWDLGGRIDLIYGTDAQKTQAYGNPNGMTRGWGFFDASLDHGYYGWAIPQLYTEVAVHDLSIKVGHFIAAAGYEQTQATKNFFHSHSFTFYDSEPSTLTGAQGKYEGFENVTLFSGWAAGWDSGFDSLEGGSVFLGGIEVRSSENLKFAYHTTIGNFGWRGDGNPNSYFHSLVLQAQLSDQLRYVAQSDYLDSGGSSVTPNNTIGMVQYLFYDFNDTLAVGGRVEWWKADGVSYYEATGGLNVHFTENFMIRPEVRQDWIPGLSFDQAVFAIDAVWEY